MKRKTETLSAKGKILVNKLDPGVFVVEIPGTNHRISLGQPPDVVKRLQQVGYYGSNAVNTFILVDSKLQDDSICWVLVEFPLLYALYLCLVEVKGQSIPAFFAGKYPTMIGLESDLTKAHKMIKYGNYGVNELDELDQMEIPAATRDALKKEILGLAVGNEIRDSRSFIHSVCLEPNPKSENEFSQVGDDLLVGRIAYNKYRFIYQNDQVDVDVTLLPEENFRAPVAYKHLKFPLINFGIWHTGEYDGMDAYSSCAHTSIIHQYEPILIDYPSNMTDIINHNGLSKQSINTIVVTHNHDDHIGAMVELFRRDTPCHIITTEPVKYSLIKKISTLIDLPENLVSKSFIWTVLPFRSDKPFQTETLNQGGLQITGHLSCHSVPTTVYTFKIDLSGYSYTYGHFLDIVSFKRMKMMVKDSWMPPEHLEHLHHIVREKKYSLIKYDAGCISEAAVPFSVHGQWQDLKNAATERSFRMFTHVNKSLLDKDYEKEGRFVEIGALDTAVRTADGRLVPFGRGLNSIIPFFFQAYGLVLKYFESLVDYPPTAEILQKMHQYAYIFANSPEQADHNIGTFLIEKGLESNYVYIIIRGRAEVLDFDVDNKLISRSTVGDGEVLGDIGVLAQKPRMAAVKTLNRLSFLTIPANLFIEAMNALNINYEGYFKQMFERRLLFQSADDVSRDVSTTVLNRIARNSQTAGVKKGEVLIKKGEKENRLLITHKKILLKAGKEQITISGPSLIGECEFFQVRDNRPPARLHSVEALEDGEILYLDPVILQEVPVIVDNIRRIIRSRRQTIYRELPEIDQTL